MRHGFVPTINLEHEAGNKAVSIPAMSQPTKHKSSKQVNLPGTDHKNSPRFTKPPRLIEKATTQPIEVINEVFDQVSLGDLIDDLLPNWLRVAVINTQSPYSDENGRELLYEFYDQLTLFVTELYMAS